MRPRVIVFDLDGTLMDTGTDIAAAVNRVLEEHGRPQLPQEEILAHVGEGIERLLAGCLGEEDGLAEAVASFNEHYARCALDHTDFFPGIRELLGDLRDRRLAVLSNKPEAFCRQILSGRGALEAFDLVCGADTWKERKPHPLALRETLAALECGPEEAFMVGDGVPDVLVGRAAGVPTCGVLWGFSTRAMLAPLEPDHLAETVADLREVLIR